MQEGIGDFDGPTGGPLSPTRHDRNRGSVLSEAINVINGDRQDVYGSPEDSFKLIAHYWNIYLQHMNKQIYAVEAKDVAIMMTLFKIAREANQHKRDNIVDAAGYLGIYADMERE